jgi:tungstate transport system substrate-binding protein
MLLRLAAGVFVLVMSAGLGSVSGHTQERAIIVASTTSTQDTGLFGYLLPIFKAKTNIDVK